MAWRVTVVVSNVNGAPVDGTELTRSVWSGGAVDKQGPTRIASDFTFEADDAALNIVCELHHPRFAPLVISMVRDQSEQTWRWTHPTRKVMTSGQNVQVGAVLGRLNWPPTSYMPEEQLDSSAQARKKPVDQRATKKSPAPAFVPVDESYRSLLTTKDKSFYRLQDVAQRSIPQFHVATPDLVGSDPSKAGWEHIAYQVAAVNPVQLGRMHIAEYGEVSSAQGPGPRFLVGVWVPNSLAQLGVSSLDFIVWLHPASTGDARRYPQDSYPYRSKYPFAIWAENAGSGYRATQRYAELSTLHLYSRHFLLYQAAAARRNAVIVVPVCPSGDFGPFISQASLFRLLKELCLWLPRGDGRGMPGRFPPPPKVGIVVVGGFSSSVTRIMTLIDSRVGLVPYDATEWLAAQSNGTRLGVEAETRTFDSIWREIWSIDGVQDGFSTFVERSLSWFSSRQDRYLRIYKSAHTGGWDLERPTSQQLKKLIAQGKTVKKESGDVRAVVVQDPQKRWTFASVSKGFVTGPTASGPPEPTLWPNTDPNNAHEMMPRVMFGHAAGLSGISRF